MKFWPAQFSWIIWRMAKQKFYPLKCFPSHHILKSSRNKFTDHLNAIWYQVQVTEVTNRFTFQIINSQMESWPGLTYCNSSFRNLQIIWSDLCFCNTFQFVKYSAPKKFFSLLAVKNEVNELLPVNSSFICSCQIKVQQLPLAVFHGSTIWTWAYLKLSFP